MKTDQVNDSDYEVELDDEALAQIDGGFSWGSLVKGVEKAGDVAETGLSAAKDAGLF